VVEEVEEQSLGVDERLAAPKGELSYLVDCERTAESVLRCGIQVEDRCDRLQVETIERATVQKKSIPLWASILEWSSAAVALGIGTTITVDASYLPDENDPLDSNPVGKAGAYSIGAILMAAGAGAAALATVDTVRALDEVDQVDKIEKTLSRTEVACEKRPLSDHFLQAHIGSRSFKVSTDAAGMTAIDLAEVIATDEILAGNVAPRLEFSADEKKISTVDLKPYFALVRRKDAERLARERKARQRVEARNAKIASLIEKGKGWDCNAWLDNHHQELAPIADYPRLDELRKCAANGTAKLSRFHFERDQVSQGKEQLERTRALDPTNANLARLEDELAAAVKRKVTHHLRSMQIYQAEQMVSRCAMHELSESDCQDLAASVAAAQLITTLSAYRDRDLRAALLPSGHKKQSAKRAKQLAKGIVLRSGMIADLAWINIDKVLGALPAGDLGFRRNCPKQDDCAVGLLRNVGADFLLAVTAGAKEQPAEINLVIPVGAALVRAERIVPAGSGRDVVSKTAVELVREAKRLAGESVAMHRKLEKRKATPADKDVIEQVPEAPDAIGRDRDTTQRPSTHDHGPYAGVNMAALFATEDDVDPPPNCTDLSDPDRPIAKPDQGATFVKPRVLMLDMRRAGGNTLAMSHRILAQEALDRTFMNVFRMKRNSYIRPCQPVDLEQLKGKQIRGVDFVFAVDLERWEEETNKKGRLTEVETDIRLRIWDLRQGRWNLYCDETITTPTWLDTAVLMSEDLRDSAIDAGLEATGQKENIQKGIDFLTEARGGVVQVELGDEEKDHYVRKVKQCLTLAARKMKKEVAELDDFRLRSPVLSRDDDLVGIGVGDSEGVRMGDTFVFARTGPDDWSGFGRVTEVGAGGSRGAVQQTDVEVIGDYDEDDSEIELLEYPQVGLLVGIQSGLMPYSHPELTLTDGRTVDGNNLGMAGVSLDIRWRITWIPLGELYLTSRLNYIFDLPIVITTVDPGLEKRWLWGRFAPAIGVRYNLGIVALPIPKAGSAGGDMEYGMALAHGLEGYLGFNIFLHPAVTLALHGGWRHYFNRPSKFEMDGNAHVYTRDNGKRWKIDLSGPYGLLGLTFEY
jgi:hypothetical protein